MKGQYNKSKLRDVRCPYCDRLLYRGEVVMVQIKCPRCKNVILHQVLSLKESISVHRDSN
jgi:phage FluMu protein Com